MKFALLLLSCALAAGTAPALAADPLKESGAPPQSERVLVIYGEDSCPKGAEDEIVVCARKPESERYRIPEAFRDKAVSPQNANESWAVRAEALEYMGRSGINSCSVIGPGGWTGCYAELLRQWQAERRAARRQNETIRSIGRGARDEEDEEE